MSTFLIVLIVAIIWIAGGFITYFAWTKDNENFTKFESVWFSIIWPLLIPLWLVHLFHNS